MCPRRWGLCRNVPTVLRRSVTRATAERRGFRAVFAGGEFRWLWLADIQSLLGDQLARVALSVLVYEQTRSGLASAAVYAATFVPALAGGVLLGPLADRLPRRGLLVTGDAARAVLVALMALQSVPLGAVVGLLVVAVAIGGPWKAAESALVADIVRGDSYVVGVGLRTATLQAAQLIGFAAGGAAVAVVGPRWSLAIDAATFAVSALVLRCGLRPRVAATRRGDRAAGQDGWLHGARAVLGDRGLRLLLTYSWLIGLLIVPEGLAAPYAAHIGGGVRSVGLLLAAGPGGVLVGSLVYSRLVSAPARAAWLAPLALAAGLPLIVCWIRPGLPVTLVLWAVSGLCMAYQVQVVTEFVTAIPAPIRGQGIAVASSGLLAAQGAGLLLGGLVAQVSSPSTAVASAGGAAVLVAAMLAIQRHRSMSGRHRWVRRACDDPAGTPEAKLASD